MKSVVQRVWMARLEVEGQVRAEFDGPGLVVLAGLEETDAESDIAWMAEKVAHLRIFPDLAGKMNLSVIDARGTVLLVPNFTLAGEAAKGRRPSFDHAMKPERAEPMFAAFVERVRALTPNVQTGVFRAHMRVTIGNDGPITILLDSRERAASPAQPPR